MRRMPQISFHSLNTLLPCSEHQARKILMISSIKPLQIPAISATNPEVSVLSVLDSSLCLKLLFVCQTVNTLPEPSRLRPCTSRPSARKISHCSSLHGIEVASRPLRPHALFSTGNLSPFSWNFDQAEHIPCVSRIVEEGVETGMSSRSSSPNIF